MIDESMRAPKFSRLSRTVVKSLCKRDHTALQACTAQSSRPSPRCIQSRLSHPIRLEVSSMTRVDSRCCVTMCQWSTLTRAWWTLEARSTSKRTRTRYLDQSILIWTLLKRLLCLSRDYRVVSQTKVLLTRTQRVWRLKWRQLRLFWRIWLVTKGSLLPEKILAFALERTELTRLHKLGHSSIQSV